MSRPVGRDPLSCLQSPFRIEIVMLTRRQLLAAAPAVVAGPLMAADPKPAFSFALVTDTHLGKPGAEYVKRMADAVAEINVSPAAFTVFCGDLVDRGEVEASQKLYPKWVEIARGLKNEWTAVPGNHDPRDQFTKQVRKETDSVI